MKDELYKEHHPETGSFRFDQETARVFDNMARRSIPYYEEVLRMSVEALRGHFSGILASRQGGIFTNKDDVAWWLYDLGSATGNFLTSFAESLITVDEYAKWKERLHLIGLDNASAMNTKARKNPIISATTGIHPRFEEADLRTYDFPPEKRQCVVSVVLQYTLQFIPREHKKRLLEKVYDVLMNGGALLISEKVKNTDSNVDMALTSYYEAFKERQGYHSLEIARKRRALQDVLTQLTLEELSSLLKQVGFQPPVILFKWYNFTTLLAIK